MAELDDDPFFRLTYENEWNACVGPQGLEVNYVDGYLEAAILLVTELIRQEMHEKRDTLAMPILYNARHAIELMLKFVIAKLVKTGVLPSAPPVNHDIKAHWEWLAHRALGDQSLTQSVASLRPYVDSLASIDEDGQELRYATNRDGDMSLAGRPLVNLEVVKQSLETLNTLMMAMKYRVYALEDERATGTYTAECSRLDLFEIAKMLPPRNNWHLPMLDEVKEKVRLRFNLGSNKLSKVFDLIQRNREMGSLLGLEFPLAHLTDDQAVQVLDLWSRRHPPRANPSAGIDFFDRDWDKVLEDRKTAFDVNDKMLKLLSLEALADVEVIFYIGRERLFCEWYEPRLASTIKRYQLEETLQVAVEDLMGKMNLLVCLIRGLQILGRPTLAERLRTLRPDLEVIS